MAQLASYTLMDRIHDGAETCVYRAVRDTDSAPVIIKTPNVPYPSRRQLARLQHEYAMLQQAGGRGTVVPIELVQSGDVVALVTEDWGGQTLHGLLTSAALGWREATTLGIHIADALAAVHDQGILHKDIKPHSVPPEGSLPLFDPRRWSAAVHADGLAGWALRIESTPLVTAGGCPGRYDAPSWTWM